MTDNVAASATWDGKLFRLYSNNITPSDASVVGDFTEMTTGSMPGYAAVTIAAASFGTVTVGSHIAGSSYPNVTFTRSTTGSAASAYGWYITDSGKTKVYAAARFASAPLTVTNAGDAIQLTQLSVTMQSVN